MAPSGAGKPVPGVQTKAQSGREGWGIRGVLIVQTKKIAALLPRRASLLAGAAVLVLAAAGAARATEFTEGDWEVNLDTTLTSSVGLRTSNQDRSFIGIANGGTYGTANADNGDLDFKPGSVVEATQRITTELQAKKDDFGIFVRATGFFDPTYDVDTDSHPFPFDRATVRDVGQDLRLLDAYVFASPSVFGHPVDVRIGNQALNWGESSFIQFGINSITALDLTGLRTPGSELRTGFLPIPAVDAKTEVAAGITVEAFWQPYWTRDKLEPVGSFFGTGDGLFDGGKYSNFFSLYPDVYDPNVVNIKQLNPFGAVIGQSSSRYPTGLGEGGIALRDHFEEMDDLEIGLYFENYDSRTPFASFRTGSPNISTPLLGPGSQILPQLPSPADLFPFLLGLQGYTAIKTYSDTDSFFADYPKNIQLVGFSYNLTGPAGIAIQGEISNRFNQPLQLAAGDLAAAVNAPAVCLGATNAILGTVLGPTCKQYRSDPIIKATGGVAKFNSVIDGYLRRDVTQWQTTFTKLFNAMPAMGINQIALVDEIGADYVHNLGSRGLWDSAYATSDNSAYILGGTVNTAPTPGTNFTVGHLSKKGLVTAFSAQNVTEAIIDMPAVLPYGIGMKPTFTLNYDFAGTSPVGANNAIENTAAASAGVTFSYLQAWTMNVQYTNHFPVFAGGKFDGLLDRDFVSATLSYEF